MADLELRNAETGYDDFLQKLTLPQYQHYLNNADAKEILLEDCLKQAMFSEHCLTEL